MKTYVSRFVYLKDASGSISRSKYIHWKRDMAPMPSECNEQAVRPANIWPF